MNVSPFVLADRRAPDKSRFDPDPEIIVVYEANPILAEGLRQILAGDPYLSKFEVQSHTSFDLVALTASPPKILIVDPWQHFGDQDSISKVFLELSEMIALIGYCADISVSEARDLCLVGFRGVMPKNVSLVQFARVVSIVGFGGNYMHDSFSKSPNGSITSLLNGIGQLSELTEREDEVLRQISLGISIKEIATLLNICTKTVDTYKTRACSKLDLRSRADIVRYAIRSGWMEIS